MMGQIGRGHLGRLGLAASLLLFVLPAAVDAHAELQSATPIDGATQVGSPVEISATYSEPMAVSGSSLRLVDPSGTEVATGGVDPANDLRMAIVPVPSLSPGVYTVQSTTRSAADGDIDRTTWTFTVVNATASPSANPTTGSTTARPTSANSTAAPTTAAATTGPTAAPTPGTVTTPGSGADVLLPIVAAVAIVGGAATWFSRRGRSSGTR